MRAAAWHKQGILVVKPDALRDDWERQCLTNIGNRLFGKRAAVPPGEEALMAKKKSSSSLAPGR